jgi:hypothetical protein
MSETTIRIMCPNLTCRKVLIVPTHSRGKTVRCRNCTTTIRVPQKRQEQAAPPPPPEQAGGDKPAKVA